MKIHQLLSVNPLKVNLDTVPSPPLGPQVTLVLFRISSFSYPPLSPPTLNESKSCSVVSDSLRPHGLYSPWNSPGQNTGVGSLSFLQGSSQPRNRTQVSCMAGGFFTSWATGEAQEYWSGEPIPSPEDLPNPGVELESSAFQADYLPTELSGKPWT